MRKKVRFIVPQLTKDIIASELNYYDFKLERLCNLIIKEFGYEVVIPAYKWSSHEPRRVINFNLTKENSVYFEDMFENTKEDSKSEFLRKVFSTYTNLHPSIRERILFRSKFQELDYITKHHLEMKVSIKNEIYDVKAISLIHCKETFYNLINLSINEEISSHRVRDLQILKIY